MLIDPKKRFGREAYLDEECKNKVLSDILKIIKTEKFDRVAYQREYMRKWRQVKK